MLHTFRQTWSVIAFDLRFNLRKPTFWIYFSLFFLLSFLFIVSDAVQIGGGVGKVLHNAPIVIAQVQLIMSIVSGILVSGIAGTAVIRDIEFKAHELFFSTGMTKFSYIVGRFIGSVITMLLIMLGTPIGVWFGTVLGPLAGWVTADKIAPFSLMGYVAPYIILVIPNALFMGALFFACGLLFRNFVAVYVQGIGLLALSSIAGTLARDIDNKMLTTLIDPFGNRAFSLLTEYWTTAERNTMILPMEGYVLWNRVLWLGIGAGIFGLTYFLFRFSAQGMTLRSRKSSAKEESSVYTITTRPRVLQRFQPKASSLQYFSGVWFYFRDIVRSGPFLAIALIGMIQFGIAARSAGRMYDGMMYPVTFIMLEVIASFTIYMLIIMVYYSGELVWRERALRVDQITDALPASRLAMMLSKITALSMVSAVLYAFVILGAMITQTLKGYTNYELPVYIVSVFGVDWVSMIQLVALSFMVHILVGNKYFGHFLVIALFIGQAFLGQIGLEHPLWFYAQTRFGTYSDMNGFLPFWQAGISYAGFYSAIALIFIIIAYMALQRGTENSVMARLRSMRMHASPLTLATLAGGILLAGGLGGWIWYNTNVLSTYRTEKEQEKLLVQYEQTYRAKYLRFPQPRIIATSVHLDLFPEERRYVSWGTHTIVNKTAQPIDTLYLNYNASLTLLKAEPDRPFHVILNDTIHGIRLLKLDQPLAPNDTARMTFSMASLRTSITMGATQIVQNGSFLNNNDVTFQFGYSADGEMSDPDKRKKYGLPERPDVPPLGDSLSRMNTYISSDADRIDFETVISTSPDQYAIAPGYLQAEWEAPVAYRPDVGTRRYFHYKMDTPILNFYSFQSARYAIARDVWKDSLHGNTVNIEIYYHPTHSYNVYRMIEATKQGLTYFSKNFSPYQHRQFRIIEFPRYAQFAQSFANTIPYSEDIGFLRKMTGEEDEIDFTFFVTAHELAHQWWAHQVIGAAQEGSTLMSESLAEYSALMVMKQYFGDNMMRRFLKHELNDYLRGRGNERKAEQPLMTNRNQSYIHYNKGSLAMYALADHIGESRVNQALAGYIRSVGFQSAPYTNAREFVNALYSVTPDSARYLVRDLFETITLFDNRAVTAQAEKQSDGSYMVTLAVTAKKMRADSTGAETDTHFGADQNNGADYIDIGIFAKSDGKTSSLGAPLYMKKYRIDRPQMQITVRVTGEPHKAGIDPYNKLIDRVASDNVINVERK
jgi:ABC-2 type transport system permease protein